MKRFSPIVMHNHDTCGGVGVCRKIMKVMHDLLSHAQSFIASDDIRNLEENIWIVDKTYGSQKTYESQKNMESQITHMNHRKNIWISKKIYELQKNI